jgi:hypothetical protein
MIDIASNVVKTMLSLFRNLPRKHHLKMKSFNPHGHLHSQPIIQDHKKDKAWVGLF